MEEKQDLVIEVAMSESAQEKLMAQLREFWARHWGGGSDR
jgi:hypothetical protein